MDFNGILQGIKNKLLPPQKIVSPLPDGYNPQNQDAYSAIEKYRPAYTGNYAQTNNILQKHGIEDLIPEIGRNVEKITRPVEDTVGRVLGNTNPAPPVPTPTLLPDAPINPHMNLIEKYFPPEEVNNASNVMFKESGNRADAVGQNSDSHSSKDYGLYQINDYWQRKNLEKKGLSFEDLLDAEKNIKYASEMQQQQGWRPWRGADSLGLND